MVWSKIYTRRDLSPQKLYAGLLTLSADALLSRLQAAEAALHFIAVYFPSRSVITFAIVGCYAIEYKENRMLEE